VKGRETAGGDLEMAHDERLCAVLFGDEPADLGVLKGTGTVVGGKGEEAFKPGDFVFMPGGERHQFKNTGKEPVNMLCLIPARE